MTSEQDSTRTTQWAWFDRWTGDFMRNESYPPIWDDMETDGYKPVIVWWDDER